MTELPMTKNKSAEITRERACLPAFAYSSLNRCNIPAVVLGGVTYQQHPVALLIDGMQALHGEFFKALDEIACSQERGVHFRQYMCSAFLLGKSEEAGLLETNSGIRRDKCDYLRLLRGWMFNADGKEAAVLKRWVESRFGLLTLNHRQPLGSHSSEAYQAYQADYVRGLYNSNALESQLDLLYSFCQYEVRRRWPEQQHCQLYRGVNHIDEHHRLGRSEQGTLLLLNNLNSFSHQRELCESFGDVILEARVPMTKLLFFPGLLADVLKGEQEYLVLGGVYQVTMSI